MPCVAASRKLQLSYRWSLAYSLQCRDYLGEYAPLIRKELHHWEKTGINTDLLERSRDANVGRNSLRYVLNTHVSTVFNHAGCEAASKDGFMFCSSIWMLHR